MALEQGSRAGRKSRWANVLQPGDKQAAYVTDNSQSGLVFFPKLLVFQTNQVPLSGVSSPPSSYLKPPSRFHAQCWAQ